MGGGGREQMSLLGVKTRKRHSNPLQTRDEHSMYVAENSRNRKKSLVTTMAGTHSPTGH